ncbi:MAG: endonuclease/exonuclease/phosphatase family protein [Solirubrobacterales bacterium]
MDRVGAHRHWLIWAAVLPVAFWAWVRLFGMERGFPLLPAMAYTPYVAVAALFVTGIAVALRNWAAATLAALATVCFLTAVLPRAIGSPEPIDGEELAVLSVNLHLGKADIPTLMGLIERRDPDLLSLQELTPGFATKLEEAGLRQIFPNAVLSLRWRASGGGIYSRLPLRKLREAQDFAFRMPRAELTLPGGSTVRVVDVHPFTPTRNGIGRWRRGLESLPRTGAGAPWVLAGDFNATLDHAELREVIDRGYRDAAEVVGEGLTPTWPYGRFWTPPITIDHVLADSRIGVAGYEVDDIPGTDHRAVFARLSIR